MKSSAPPRRAASRILSSSKAFVGSPKPMLSLILVHLDEICDYDLGHSQIKENEYNLGKGQKLSAANLPASES